MAKQAQDRVKANYDWEKITTDNLKVYSQNLGANLAEIVDAVEDNSQLESSKEKITQS